MTVKSNLSTDKKNMNIEISGHFDFSAQKDFRDTYRDRNESGLRFSINLSKVEYMDSAALGMLMVLKKHADAHSSQVVLQAPSATIKKILLTSKFDKLFSIET